MLQMLVWLLIPLFTLDEMSKEDGLSEGSMRIERLFFSFAYTPILGGESTIDLLPCGRLELEV